MDNTKTRSDLNRFFSWGLSFLFAALALALGAALSLGACSPGAPFTREGRILTARGDAPPGRAAVTFVPGPLGVSLFVEMPLGAPAPERPYALCLGGEGAGCAQTIYAGEGGIDFTSHPLAVPIIQGILAPGPGLNGLMDWALRRRDDRLLGALACHLDAAGTEEDAQARAQALAVQVRDETNAWIEEMALMTQPGVGSRSIATARLGDDLYGPCRDVERARDTLREPSREDLAVAMP